MFSKFVIRDQIVANAVHRICRLFNQNNNIRYFANGLIFRTDFNTHQMIRVRQAKIIEDNQIEQFLNQPRIFPGLHLTEDVVDYISSLSPFERTEILRNLLVEAIDLGIQLSLLNDYRVACGRVLSNPKRWTNIPDIKKPFTTRKS